jgi:hypothetical protein
VKPGLVGLGLAPTRPGSFERIRSATANGSPTCTVPGCTRRRDSSSHEGFCRDHHMLCWNFGNWLHGYAISHFDKDRRALERHV